MLKTPLSVHTCSSSPRSERSGSALSVVLPVPDKPKKRVTSPLGPWLHDEWRGSTPRSGMWYIIRVSTPFFISPAYCEPRMTTSPRPKCRSMVHEDVIPATYLRGEEEGGMWEGV
eukprot:6214557-Pleurochrysis_carterae.AAC.3